MNDFEELKCFMPLFLQGKGININQKFKCLNPAHNDKNPSMSFNFSKSNVHCFSCGMTYDIFDLVGIEYGLTDSKEQLEKVRELYGGGAPEPMPQKQSPPRQRQPADNEKRYAYKTIAGTHVRNKVRIDYTDRDGKPAKRMWTETVMESDEPAMYGDFRQYQQGEKVYICEGEKCVDACLEHGLTAVTPGGSTSWKSCFAPFFAGCNVVVLADNDEPGRAFALSIIRDLTQVAKSALMLVPSTIEKGDIYDFFAEGKTVEDLLELEGQARQSLIGVPVQQSEDEDIYIRNKNGEPVRVRHISVYNAVLKTTPVVFCGGVPYIYGGGVYREDADGKRLKRMIKDLLLPDFITAGTIDKIYKLFSDSEELHRELHEMNRYPDGWINFADTMIDPDEMREVPHSPKFLAINQSPHRWSDVRNATNGRRFDDFIRFAVPDADDRKMLFEYFGLCLTKDTKYQKFLILSGRGGTGKSTLINLIERAVGSENASHVALQDFQTRFASSALVGKTLNTCADLPASVVRDASDIKKIIGEDAIQAEHKGKPSFSFRSKAKLIFSTNTIPIFENEEGGGLARRALICRMDRQPEEAHAGLENELADEMPYIVKRMVEGLKRLHDAGHIEESESCRQAVRQMQRDSDSVEDWICERCEVSSSLTGYQELYRDYERFCRTEDISLLPKKRFFNALRSKGIIEGYRRFGLKIKHT